MVPLGMPRQATQRQSTLDKLSCWLQNVATYMGGNIGNLRVTAHVT
jgi:hypothetical protein